jgi:hypothetical protein
MLVCCDYKKVAEELIKQRDRIVLVWDQEPSEQYMFLALSVSSKIHM